jgi:hypothetical protein
MEEQAKPRSSWLARWRERRRRKRERTGDSPEKLEERHVPRGDVIDLMLKAGGVERESSFAKQKPHAR